MCVGRGWVTPTGDAACRGCGGSDLSAWARLKKCNMRHNGGTETHTLAWSRAVQLCPQNLTRLHWHIRLQVGLCALHEAVLSVWENSSTHRAMGVCARAAAAASPRDNRTHLVSPWLRHPPRIGRAPSRYRPDDAAVTGPEASCSAHNRTWARTMGARTCALPRRAVACRRALGCMHWTPTRAAWALHPEPAGAGWGRAQRRFQVVVYGC